MSVYGASVSLYKQEKTEGLEEKHVQFHFIHKFHMECSERESETPLWETGG
jgi:hypothetical protein